MVNLLGEYASVASDGFLMAQQHQQHPTELAGLHGKRLLVASETEEGGTLRLQLVKQLTGDEQIKARFMRQDFFTFPRTHKLLMVTNNRPRIPENNEAAWRRIRLVPFEVTIPLEKRDPLLLAKFKSASEGILAWIVRGSVDRITNGMQAPQCVIAATNAYRDESDPLADYVTDRLDLGDDKRIIRGEAWMDYEAWTIQVGEKGSLKRDGFYARLRQLHNVKDSQWKFGGQKVRGFSGVGLKTA